MKRNVARHTPGPWRYLAADGVIVGKDRPGLRATDEIAWSVADYRLIAAAPELLDALRDCVCALNDEQVAAADDEHPTLAAHRKTMERARKAIEKAEGRS